MPKPPWHALKTHFCEGCGRHLRHPLASALTPDACAADRLTFVLLVLGLGRRRLRSSPRILSFPTTPGRAAWILSPHLAAIHSHAPDGSHTHTHTHTHTQDTQKNNYNPYIYAFV